MLNKLIPTAIYFFIFTFIAFAQSYKMTIKNETLIEKNKYEFDIFIESNSGSLDLTSYQVSLNYETNDSTINFSYINGTSELNNIPVVSIGIFPNVNKYVLTFASLPDSDTIDENEKRVGRFVLFGNKSLEGLQVFWNFYGNAVTILTGPGFADITNPLNHYPKIKHSNYYLEKNASDNTINPGAVTDFELFQNYPNPFNPSTTIKYTIASDSFVRLKIFNVLGEEIKSLINEFQSPGIYEVKFHAESLPSGYYIYSLYTNNNLISNKKMILLK